MHTHDRFACLPAALVLLAAGLLATASPARAADAAAASPPSKTEFSTILPGPAGLTALERAKVAEALDRASVAIPSGSFGPDGVTTVLLAGPAVPKRLSWGTVGPALPPDVVVARLRAKLEALKRGGR